MHSNLGVRLYPWNESQTWPGQGFINSEEISKSSNGNAEVNVWACVVPGINFYYNWFSKAGAGGTIKIGVRFTLYSRMSLGELAQLLFYYLQVYFMSELAMSFVIVAMPTFQCSARAAEYWVCETCVRVFQALRSVYRVE